jgi:hypothetical protein
MPDSTPSHGLTISVTLPAAKELLHDVRLLTPRHEYWTAFVLGFGLLLPWYAFLNTFPFFSQLFPSAPVSFWVTVAFNSPQLPSQLLLLAGGKWASPRLPLGVGFALQALLLLATPLTSVASRSIIVLIVLATVSGGATAVLESALFGGCAELGAGAAAASQAVLAGEGLASLCANVIQIVLYFSDKAVRTELMYVYFALVAGVMGCCAILSFPFSEHVAAATVAAATGGDTGDGTHRAVEYSGRTEDIRTPLISTPRSSLMAARVQAARVRLGITAEQKMAAAVEAASAPPSALRSMHTAISLALGVASACWPTLFAIFISMVLTFLVYPGVASNVRFGASDGGGTSILAQDEGTWTLLLFFINAVGDLIGRLLAATRWGGFAWLGGADVGDSAPPPALSGKYSSNDRLRGFDSLLMRRVAATIVYNVLRAFTLIIFIASVRGWRPSHSDVIVALNMVVFAVSNGHAQTLAMMYGPLMVAPAHRGTAGVLHVLCLIAGLWCGSFGALWLA